MSEMDHIFKNKLKNHTSPVSKTSWANIEKRLPRQKSGNRLVGWGIASVFIIAVAGSLMLAGYLDEKNTVHFKNKLPAKNIEKTWIAAAVTESDEYSIPTKVTEKYHDKVKSSLTDNQIRLSQNEQTEELVTSPVYKPEADAIHNHLNTGAGTYEHNETYSFMKKDLVSESAETSLISDTEVTLADTHLKKEREMENIPALVSQKDKSQLDGVRLNHVTRDKEACSFIWRGYQKSLDIYYSSDFADIQLSGPEEFSSYVDMREATEKTVYSHSMGVRMGYNIGYRWNLHTGLQYSQMNQRFQYTDPEAHEPRIEIIKQYIYSNGQLVDSTFTEKVEYLPGSKHHRIYNKYSTFDIPVLARYTMAANNRWSISAMAGVFLNVAFQQSGIILDRDNTTPIYLAQESEGTQIFKAGLGVSFYSALSMAYYLSPAWDLLVEPNMRVAPSSMTTSDYPLKQRFNVYGLGVGLRYRF